MTFLMAGGATTEDSYPSLVYSTQQGGPHFHSPRQTFRIKVRSSGGKE